MGSPSRRGIYALVGLALVCGGAGCGGGESSTPGGQRGGTDTIGQQIHEQIQKNQSTLPAGTDSATPLPPQSISEMVRRYQPAGFFTGERVSSATARLRRAYRRAYGENAQAPATRADELALIAADGRQAWYSDIERDVINGNDEYVRAFGEWARASHGSFAPRQVRERWRGENGPVDISFSLNKQRHSARARGVGDFLDLCVLIRDVNKTIARSGVRFELYRPDAALGQVAFAAALTKHQKRHLENLGWEFASTAEVGHVFGYGQLYETGDSSGC